MNTNAPYHVHQVHLTPPPPATYKRQPSAKRLALIAEGEKRRLARAARAVKRLDYYQQQEISRQIEANEPFWPWVLVLGAVGIFFAAPYIGAVLITLYRSMSGGLP